MKRKEEIENDLWFANQLEAIRQMESPRKVDVTDAVMKQLECRQLLASQPQQKKRTWLKVSSGAAAAGVAAAIVFAVGLSENGAKAETTQTVDRHELSTRIADVYEYCNDYADPEYDDEAAYYDNPIYDFI